MIEINLPVPPSVNALYANRKGGGGRFKTKAYRDWIANADAYFLAQRRRLDPEFISAPYELEIRIPKATRGDADNRVKAVSDFLVRVQVTPDDRHCQKVTIERDASVPALICLVRVLPSTVNARS